MSSVIDEFTVTPDYDDLLWYDMDIDYEGIIEWITLFDKSKLNEEEDIVSIMAEQQKKGKLNVDTLPFIDCYIDNQQDTVGVKQITNNSSRKNKKGKNKKLNSQLTSENQNNSWSYQCDQRLIIIPKQINSTLPDAIIEQIGKHEIYHYMKNTIMLQSHDGQIDNNNKDKTTIIHFDLHDRESNDILYGIAKRSGNQWRLEDKLVTANEMEQKQDQITGATLPKSSRSKFAKEISNMHSMRLLLMDKLQEISGSYKWQEIEIFRKKNNERRMTLSLTNEQFKQKIQSCNMKNIIVIPIIVFNNTYNTHRMEYILMVQIESNIYIGISFRLSSNNQMEIASIHLDDGYIKRQHIFTEPHGINECQICEFLNNWESNKFITDLKIFGNLDDDENRIKSYKQRYEAMKNSLYNVINEESFDDTDKLKQLMLQIQVAVKSDNGSLMRTQNASKSPSISSSISRSISSSLDSPISSDKDCSLPVNAQIISPIQRNAMQNINTTGMMSNISISGFCACDLSGNIYNGLCTMPNNVSSSNSTHLITSMDATINQTQMQSINITRNATNNIQFEGNYLSTKNFMQNLNGISSIQQSGCNLSTNSYSGNPSMERI